MRCMERTNLQGKEHSYQYDAVVLGSAAYIVHWLKDATTPAKRRRGCKPAKSDFAAAAQSETALLMKTA